MKNFLSYYHDELLFLRKKGGEFAKSHPEIASKLDIKDGESTDPQTERIVESVAFMSAKLNQKIDDNAQNIAFYLLSALYPNLINVFPACGVVKFESENSVAISDNMTINRGTNLFIKSKNGSECQFKTVYPITIYPISVVDISLFKTGKKLGGIDGWAIEINIETNSVPLEQILPNDLLFHINSDIIENSLMIYEALFSNPKRNFFLKIDERYIKINSEDVIQCGFDDIDSVCPVSRYSTNSFQLFQEMLHFKRKFMFFRILKIGDLILNSGLKNLSEMSIIVDVDISNDRLFEIIKSDSISLNSTPIVNLFQVTSDPFRFDGTKSKYMLLADQTRDSSIEIHSISEVHIINNETKNDEIVQPYFFLAIDSDTNVMHDLYWLYSKESSELRRLGGFDTYISFIDTKMNPQKIYADVVYAKTLCTNRFATRDIPIFSKMYIDNVETGGYFAKLLQKTSSPISFSENTNSLWNLISQLTATHISISNAENFISAIKQLVDIFSSGDKVKSNELFGGIKSVSIDERVQRFGKDAWRGFVKGKEITIIISDENTFFSYFFCCIINQYLSDSISINSFVTLKMKSQTTGKILATWNPTSGKRDLL